MREYLLERITVYCTLSKTKLADYRVQNGHLTDAELELKVTEDEKAFWEKWDRELDVLRAQILATDMELMKLKRRVA